MMLALRLALSAFLTANAQTTLEKPLWNDRTVGILLLSHGGSTQWNQAVLGVEGVVSSSYPVETAFGMADPMEIQRVIDDLLALHVKKIVAVPLFISSHSEVIEQTKYVLGMRQDPSAAFVNAPHTHMSHVMLARARSGVPVVLAPALDDDSVVAEILFDRAKKMSHNPSKEYVILVGHGPLGEADNAQWLEAMNTLGRDIQKRGGFAGAYAATLRDDSPADVKAKADKVLRDLVASLSLKGKILLVPDLVAPGGIERHVLQALDGLFFEWTGETLLPDPRIARWVMRRVDQYKSQPDMRRFKDPGHPLPEAPLFKKEASAATPVRTP